MRWIVLGIVVLVGLASANPAAAQAQSITFRGYATPFVGVSAGGSLDSAIVSMGASVAVHDPSGWGAELDASFSNDNNAQSREADFTSLMVNFAFARPTGPLRPYVTGGVGLLSLHGCLTTCPTPITANDFGMNAGGGAYYLLNDMAGFRGDVRYIWAPGDHPNRPSNYGYWRATIGVTFMWVTPP